MKQSGRGFHNTTVSDNISTSLPFLTAHRSLTQLIAKDYNVTTTVLFTSLLLCLQQVHFYSHSWNTFTVNLHWSYSGFEIHISIILVDQCHTLSTPFAHYTWYFLSLFFLSTSSFPSSVLFLSLCQWSHSSSPPLSLPIFSFLASISIFTIIQAFLCCPVFSLFLILRFSSSLWTK